MSKIITEQYDKELLNLNIYSKFPQMLPLIGSNYSSNFKKVLFVGESHYLPNSSNIHNNSTEWYSLDQSVLNDNEKDWINTRETAGSGINQKYNSKAFSIYRNIEKGILNSGFNPEMKDNMFRFCAFYNYFLRPAETGKSISRDELDKDKSFENIINLEKILGFEYVIFVSKLAYNDFNWYFKNRKNQLKFKYFSLPHPGCLWWNRKSKSYLNSKGESLNGKEKLIEIISENKLFEN